MCIITKDQAVKEGPINYAKQLEKTAINTNWFETKSKFDPIYQTKIEKKRMEEKNKIAIKQIKIVRNQNLKQLYEIESEG